jgi:hypothetical protein
MVAIPGRPCVAGWLIAINIRFCLPWEQAACQLHHSFAATPVTRSSYAFNFGALRDACYCRGQTEARVRDRKCSGNCGTISANSPKLWVYVENFDVQRVETGAVFGVHSDRGPQQ